MSDLASLAATPRTIILGDSEYKISPFRLRDLSELAAYLKDVVPHPVAAMRPALEGMSSEDKALAFQGAFVEARSWPPGVDSDQGQQVLVYTQAGRAKLVYVILSRHQPELTPDDALKIADSLTVDQFERITSLASGKEHAVPNSDPATVKVSPSPMSHSLPESSRRQGGRSKRS